MIEGHCTGFSGRGNYPQATGTRPTDAEEWYLAYESMAWMDYRRDQECLLLDVLLMLNFCERNSLPLGVACGSAVFGVTLDVLRLPGVARRYHQRAVELAEHIRHPIAIGLACLARGLHEYCRDDCDAALEYLRKAAAAYWDGGGLRGWGAATAITARVHRLRGQFAESLARTEEMLRVGQDAADASLQSWALGDRARILWRTGSPEAAIRPFQEAIALFKTIPDYMSMADALSELATCYLRQGKLDEASTLLADSERLITERRLRGFEITQPRIALAECRLRDAERCRGAARAQALRSAKYACQAALKQSKTFHDCAPGAYRMLGTYKWIRGHRTAARNFWQQSLTAADALGARYEWALTELEIGRLLRERHRLEQAEAVFAALDARLDLAVARALLTHAQFVPAARECT